MNHGALMSFLSSLCSSNGRLTSAYARAGVIISTEQRDQVWESIISPSFFFPPSVTAAALHSEASLQKNGSEELNCKMMSSEMHRYEKPHL